MPQKKIPQTAVYDNRGMVGIVLRPGTSTVFFPIFLREFYLQGPFLWCFFPWFFVRVSSLKSLERRLHGWQKKMPSLKWSHGVKGHHFVFSLVPFICCCKHEFQFPWYNCQFFCSRFGYNKSHKGFSCAQSPVADSPLTRSWWINVEKSPRKIFETKNRPGRSESNKSAICSSKIVFFCDEIIQR